MFDYLPTKRENVYNTFTFDYRLTHKLCSAYAAHEKY